MKLFCGKSPKTLGISDAGGNWDMRAFREHVDGCEVCKCGVGKIMGMAGSATSERKADSSRANGKKGGRPKK